MESLASSKGKFVAAGNDLLMHDQSVLGAGQTGMMRFALGRNGWSQSPIDGKFAGWISAVADPDQIRARTMRFVISDTSGSAHRHAHWGQPPHRSRRLHSKLGISEFEAEVLPEAKTRSHPQTPAAGKSRRHGRRRHQ